MIACFQTPDAFTTYGTDFLWMQ